MFFDYRQNNSGGYWDDDENIARNMIFEADSSDEANNFAEAAGLYFNGCAGGRDCECCGNRWSRAWSDDGDEVPSYYGTPITDEYQEVEQCVNPDIILHMKDGTRTFWRSNGRKD